MHGQFPTRRRHKSATGRLLRLTLFRAGFCLAGAGAVKFAL